MNHRHHFAWAALLLSVAFPTHSSGQLLRPSEEQTHSQLSDRRPQSTNPVGEVTRAHAFGLIDQSEPAPMRKPLYTSDQGVTIWGNVVFCRSWSGEGAASEPCFYDYTYSPSSGLSSSVLAHDSWMFANGSGAFYDGKFHFISKGYTTYLYGVYDTDSWEQLYQEQNVTKFHKLVATDCDYDPVTGLTYGCFWNPEKGEYEFASVDYESCTHTSIGPMEIFSAIAINSKGEVYGIKESDGGLYRIDKATGEQTFIGSTGIKPYLIQSAAFDRTNDVLYWAVRATGSVAYLATVNTDNGATKRLAYFPDNEQITCLFVPSYAAQTAPARVENYTITPPAGDSNYTVDFIMPAVAVDGSSLSGTSLEYTITLGGAVKTTGKAMAGAKVTERIALADGYNALAIYASNANGKGVEIDRRVWAGPDTPSPVRDVAVSVDTDADNKVSLSWNVSDFGVHNGYIGASAITFDVVRMPGNKLVSSRQSGTSFTETLGNENAGIYYYVITPYVGSQAGESVESAKISALGIFPVPFKETFDTQASFNSFKVIDSNADKTTWFWNEKMNLAEYYVNWVGDADDWLLSPELALKAGRLYELSFDCRGWEPDYPEYLRVAFGTGTDVTAYTDIMPRTELKSSDMYTYKFLFSVPADGAYRVGFHCTSPKTSMYVLIDNFEVTVGPLAGAPGKPSSLKLIPDTKGELKTTILFNAPRLKADGSALTSDVDMLVYRNDETEPCATVKGAAAGSSQVVIDTPTITGVNTYYIYAVNEEGQSLPESESVYVGQDRPQAPTDVTVAENEGKLILTWTAPSAVGISRPSHPVIPEALTYNVYGPDRSLIEEGVSQLFYELPEKYSNGPQDLLSFYVNGVSPAGEGAVGSSNYIIAGKPYDLPLRESFPNGMAPATFWWVGGNNVFQPTSETSYDGDGGCIRWKNTYFDKYGWFNSGKINISQAEKPVLSFAYLMNPGKKFVIKTYLSVDGGANKLLGQIDFASEKGQQEWRTVAYDLSDYKNSSNVIFKLYVDCREDYDYDRELYFYVDQINVTDTEGTNLTAASITGPSDLFVGQEGVFNVMVENSAGKSSNFTVNLYKNGELLQTSESTTISPQSLLTVPFSFTPAVTAEDRMELYAEIVCDGDLYPSDNLTETLSVDIRRPSYPVVNDLTASTDDNKVTLSWNEPVQTDGVTDESFEDYTHKDTSFGDWYTVDNDKGRVYSNQIVDVGYMNVPVSWVVFNSIAAGVPEEDVPYYAAHSGTTSLLGLISQATTIPGGGLTDDWLISPELSTAQAHTVSFWAKSVKGEKYGLIPFQVLYTNSYSNNLSEYVIVMSENAPVDWKEYSVEIPEGARFFAIRFLAEYGFYIMVDDIRFELGRMPVKGYTIFRDGVKIADLEATRTSYVDTAVAPSEDHTYHVTVKYGNGESALSNPAEIGAGAALDAIGSDIPEGPFDIYSIDGVRIRHNVTSTAGLPRGIYIVNNRKVAVL